MSDEVTMACTTEARAYMLLSVGASACACVGYVINRDEYLPAEVRVAVAGMTAPSSSIFFSMVAML